jgi:RNA recognition motif-containing protein
MRYRLELTCPLEPVCRGEISDAVVMEGRGFGFVTFADPANAEAFLQQREHSIDGKRVEAKNAVPKSDGMGGGGGGGGMGGGYGSARVNPTKIFVGGTVGGLRIRILDLCFLFLISSRTRIRKFAINSNIVGRPRRRGLPCLFRTVWRDQ